MPVTVGANTLSVVHKSSNGITIVFPDVCKTPILGVPVPIPYPNVAQSARSAQKATKVKVGVQKVVKKGSKYSRSTGDESGVNKSILSSKVMGEATQLRGMLNQLNGKLQALQSDDPNEWQKVLQDYVVAAGALFTTLTIGQNG
jgi:hypothetical protein